MAGNRAALARLRRAADGRPRAARPPGRGRTSRCWWSGARPTGSIPPEHGEAYADGHPRRPARWCSPRPGTCPSSRRRRRLLAAVREFARSAMSRADQRSRSSARTTARVALSGPVRMRILEDGSTTAHRLGMGEITIAPHTAGPPQHRHGQHDEGFYVVSGTVRFTVGDDLVRRAGPHPGHGAARRPAHLRQPRRRAGRAAQHVHPGPVRAVLPRPARHDRRWPAAIRGIIGETMRRYATS